MIATFSKAAGSKDMEQNIEGAWTLSGMHWWMTPTERQQMRWDAGTSGLICQLPGTVKWLSSSDVVCAFVIPKEQL
jgi:hypothetical protein